LRNAKYVIILLVMLISLPVSLSGQFYFGKNKVNYETFEWNILETDHFRIYFYDEEGWLAEITAHYAEESYDYLESKFNLHIFKKTPLIIYSSPNYFTQTNVIPQILPENVGGFTEFYKGRMVVPFDGSLYDFLRIVQHELVHVFTYAKLTAELRDHRKLTLYGPPLWFTEGIAEYWSRPWSPEADMMIADLMISGNFISYENIYAISGTYLMYKVGESLCKFIAEEYGEDKLLLIFENWWKHKNFEKVIHYTFGKSLKTLFNEWQYSLKKRYFPTMAESDYPGEFAVRTSKRGFFVKPVIVETVTDTGIIEEVIYKANQLGYSGIYKKPLGGPNGKEKTVLKGERSSKFESLHLLRSSISASRLGELVFASRRHDRDVLYFMDLKNNKIERSESFDNLVSIVSPSFSADGSLVVFSGASKDGRFDLYIFDVRNADLRRLTEDLYDDRSPSFSPDGNRIVFSSDRGESGLDGYVNLFEFDLVTDEIKQITSGSHKDLSPSYSSDGRWILFTSDRAGRANIYALGIDDSLYKIGNTLTGCFDPRFSPSDSLIVFSAFQEYGFQIYTMPFADSVMTPVEREEILLSGWEPLKVNGSHKEGSIKYETDYSLDIAQSAVAFDAVYGSAGGIQVGLSDMLGNHQYHFLLYNTSQTKSDFLSSFNLAATYVNRERRLNYAYGLYHFYDEYDDRHDGLFSERVYGALGTISYPFSKFRRIETSLYIRRSEKYRFFPGTYRDAWLMTSYLSFVKDNAIWDFTGPLDGSRYILTAGWTYDWETNRVFNRLFMADLRKYFRLGRYSAFAMRAFGYTSTGKEPQRLYLGGSWNLRGYDRRTWYDRNILLFSNELRFPLINRLQIGLPFGNIGFSGIRGALFFDAGSAWGDKFERFYGAFGVGARVALGYFLVLRFDLARTTDFIIVSDKWKFDFFFGWNF
jgi:WD40-like Beta Propeller Repeat